MNRRNFLKATGSTLILPLLPGGLPLAHAAGPLTLAQRTLAYIGLYGGPDVRHLCPPVITASTDSQSYAFQFWSARAKSFGIAEAQRNLQGFVEHFNAHYQPVNHPGTAVPAGFGILKQAGWLIDMWNAGRVALMCNAVGAVSRDHAHAQLVLDHGDLTSTAADMLKPGWGGKLVTRLGGFNRVAALTNSPKPFCFCPLAGNPKDHDNSRVLSVKNSRAMQLAEYRNGDANPNGYNNVIARSLKGYYAGTGSGNARTQLFREHEAKLRNFGNQLYQRLGPEVATATSTGIPVPPAIRALYHTNTGAPDLRLHNRSFGAQLRNLHDVIAAADILGLRVAAMDYGNWDTHGTQYVQLDRNFNDLFGTGRGLDCLYASLDATARNNLVFTLAGEFGRQLASNGDNGTDHGRGNIVIIIGDRVRGGVYGTMFPQTELTPVNLFTRNRNDDVKGLTSFEHIFGAVADWVAGTGTGTDIFPNRASAPIESGLNLSTLFL